MPHTAAAAARIQAAATAHVATDLYYLNPVQVVRENLAREGFTSPFTITLPIRATVSDQGTVYIVSLTQPVRTGPTGIWAISTIMARAGSPAAGTPAPSRPGVHVGVIPHGAAGEQKIQARADARNSAYTYFLNPARVLWTNLGQYGFSRPFTVSTFTVTIHYQGRSYDVTLAQPAKHGPGGVWLITTIGPHRS